MELRNTLEQADVVALAGLRWRALPQTPGRLRRMRLTCQLAFAALALGSWLLAQDIWLAAAFLALAVLVPLLNPVMYNYRVKQAAKEAYRAALAQERQDGQSRLAHTLRIADDGLVAVAYAGESRLRWPVVDGQTVTADRAFIRLSGVPCIAIPRSQVAPADLEAFLTACQERHRQAVESENRSAANP